MPLEKPPFEAYCTTCGVTFTFGGVRIDTDGRVLDIAQADPRSLCGRGAGWWSVLFQLSGWNGPGVRVRFRKDSWNHRRPADRAQRIRRATLEIVDNAGMRPNCECCDRDLPPELGSARICSFECTFCRDCAERMLSGRCPNCGGELVRRPIRPAERLLRHPAATRRIFKPARVRTRHDSGMTLPCVLAPRAGAALYRDGRAARRERARGGRRAM